MTSSIKSLLGSTRLDEAFGSKTLKYAIEPIDGVDWLKLRFLTIYAKRFVQRAWIQKTSCRTLWRPSSGNNFMKIPSIALIFFPNLFSCDLHRWGEWGAPLSCSSGYLTAFRLRVQRPLVQEDETAVNDVQFECSSGQVLAGNGLLNGEWGPWSGHCPAGICSFESRIQEYQGVFSDDTALNNLLFYCCWIIMSSYMQIKSISMKRNLNKISYQISQL